ncbi:hypothetical protein AGDE_15655 [Angomonas deanei]|uniref:Uncharacterized protein n=1 Tax=Angomonas deanei TaxID=59799 RepID=A0A7G2CI05_9TRYP|nr:hypothetical protein AGDE_15655 [Angomonas deanei]CAD2217852.1 hypothetical protein, conserved [Angomonas deanei]|eukprot:EPY18704.1 hypothetical protein AGDE_15655 [Angomonas deanei]
MDVDPFSLPTIIKPFPLSAIASLTTFATSRSSFPAIADGVSIMKSNSDGREFLKIDFRGIFPLSESHTVLGVQPVSVSFSPQGRGTVFGPSLKVKVSLTSLSLPLSNYKLSISVMKQKSDSAVARVVDSIETTGREYTLDLAADAYSLGGETFVVSVSVLSTEPTTYNQLVLAKTDRYELVDDKDMDRVMDDDEEGFQEDADVDDVDECVQYAESRSCALFELSSEREERSALIERASDLIYQDVLCVPVGIVEVNGVRGFACDLKLLPDSLSESRSLGVPKDLFSHSLLESLSHLLDKEFYEQMRRAVADASSPVFQLVRLEEVERNRLQHELLLAFSQLYSDSTVGRQAKLEHNELSPQAPESNASFLHIAAGRPVLWREFTPTAEYDHFTALPPEVPLFTMSIFPRLSHVENSKNHRSVVTKNAAKADVKGLSFIDWSFVRLPPPILPNINKSYFEYNPTSLKNRDRLLLDYYQKNAEKWTQGQFLGSVRAVSRLLCPFLLLQCLENDTSSHGDSRVYELIHDNCDISKEELPNTFSTRSYLYLLSEKEGTYDLLIGGKPDYNSDAFEPPEKYPDYLQITHGAPPRFPP